MKLPKSEFDQFWDEVCGDEWYIEDTDFDDQSDVIDLPEEMRIVFNGFCSFSTNDVIREEDVEDDDLLIVPAIKRWRILKLNTTIVAKWTVPNEQAPGLRKAIEALGGKFN